MGLFSEAALAAALGVVLFSCSQGSPAQPATPDSMRAAAAADEPLPPPEEAPSDTLDAEAWEGEDEALAEQAGDSESPAATADTRSGQVHEAHDARTAQEPETRTPEVIAELVKQHRSEVRSCYERALETKASLQGELVIRFVLSRWGKVRTAELNEAQSTLTDPQVLACAVEVIKRIDFPPSSRGMESQVDYPFSLKPR